MWCCITLYDNAVQYINMIHACYMCLYVHIHTLITQVCGYGRMYIYTCICVCIHVLLPIGKYVYTFLHIDIHKYRHECNDQYWV